VVEPALALEGGQLLDGVGDLVVGDHDPLPLRLVLDELTLDDLVNRHAPDLRLEEDVQVLRPALGVHPDELTVLLVELARRDGGAVHLGRPGRGRRAAPATPLRARPERDDEHDDDDPEEDVGEDAAGVRPQGVEHGTALRIVERGEPGVTAAGLERVAP
jgi:hypothetical protein